MKLRIVPAARGVTWVRHGFKAFLMRPLAFIGLFGAMLLAMLVTQLVPWLGPLLFLASLPLMTLGFMLATQQVTQGGFPWPNVFITPLRVERVRTLALLRLGAGYALGMVVVILLREWIDGGRMDELQAALANANASPQRMVELVSDVRLQLGLLTFIVLGSLLSVPFWHAPALVHWGRLGAGKALFFSTVACWRNKGAFLMYGLAWSGAMVVFMVVCTALLTLLGQPQSVTAVMVPGVLTLSMVFYASLYFTFADCFEVPAP